MNNVSSPVALGMDFSDANINVSSHKGHIFMNNGSFTFVYKGNLKRTCEFLIDRYNLY